MSDATRQVPTTNSDFPASAVSFSPLHIITTFSNSNSLLDHECRLPTHERPSKQLATMGTANNTADELERFLQKTDSTPGLHDFSCIKMAPSRQFCPMVFKDHLLARLPPFHGRFNQPATAEP